MATKLSLFFKRFCNNPLLKPNPTVDWENIAAFNPCVVKENNKFHMLYRALGTSVENSSMPTISTIAYAESDDGFNFSHRRQLIKPTETWERYGCEDPRVTFLDKKYYIFYTALSEYPFTPSGIRVGMAMSKNFEDIPEKQLITPFNAKAMALFPEKINGQFVAILTVNTDLPPAKIAIAYFNNESDMWSEAYWTLWYQSLDSHIIPLLRNRNDHVEVGAPPIKTEKGWLLLYSYIQNYFSDDKVFGIEAVLLDLNKPEKVIARITQPLLLPETDYEKKGLVPNIAFPSGAVLEQDTIFLYYGGADTTCCLATLSLNELLTTLIKQSTDEFIITDEPKHFSRFNGNPILAPRLELYWEAQATFNPAALFLDGNFHIIYRAMGFDFTSVFGYAKSHDGFHIDERSLLPIYQPRAEFEQKLRPGYSGCEDPRLTVIDGFIYMLYTGYDGYTPRVALTFISVDDFIKQRWNWSIPVAISPPDVDDKNACLFPKKIQGQYVILHRRNKKICINFLKDLHFGPNQWLVEEKHLIQRKSDYLYNKKFGISTPPIETEQGWLVFFHRVTLNDNIYKIGAMLLDINDPSVMLSMTNNTLLEPLMEYERHGITSNVVFPCGAVLLENILYLYYGCGDHVISVAKMALTDVLATLGKK